jgi:hypothetical protein
MAVSLKENNCFFVTDQTPRPYPTRSLPAQLWHWCREWSTYVGLDNAINHWRKLAWLRFEPGSSKWHTGALSTTPQAHAPFLKKVARAGFRTRCLLIPSGFSFHYFTAEPQRLPILTYFSFSFLLPNFPGTCSPWGIQRRGRCGFLCQVSGTNQYWYRLLWHPMLRCQFRTNPANVFFMGINMCPSMLSTDDYTIFLEVVACQFKNLTILFLKHLSCHTNS